MLHVIETPEEVLEQISKPAHTPKGLTEQDIELLRERIDSASVSEAAKEFYREHLATLGLCCTRKFMANNLGDAYALLRELDDAGLIMTKVVFLGS